MNAYRQQVLDWIDAHRDEQIDLLRRLVAERSVLFNERGAQDVIAGALAPLELELDRWEIDPDALRERPGYAPVDWSYAGRENIACRWPGAGGGRSLIFNGHVDVVPTTPDEHWTHDPWAGDIVDGRMIGRGAADMKAGVTAMIHATRALKASGVRLAGDLTLQSVIEEECTGNGTLATLERGYRADAAIVPEPFGEHLVNAHLGVLWCRITVRGRGAHAEQASSSVNAIRKAAVVIDAIETLQDQRNDEPPPVPEYAEVSAPINYNVGVIEGGDWPSSSPEKCMLRVRIACYPGETLPDVKARFVEGLRRETAHDGWLAEHPPECEFYAFHAEGYTIPADAPLLHTLSGAHAAVRGVPAGHHPFTGTTDARYFALYAGMPAVCYGPSCGQVHAPDEWVDLESLHSVTRVLALAAMDWCGVADG